MKTEDVRMTEIAINPYLTLILFSVPPSARTANATPRNLGGDARLDCRAACDAGWHGSRPQIVFAETRSS